MGKSIDALFAWCERLQSGDFGDVLDAGTGDQSLSWLVGTAHQSLTAVTVENWRIMGLQAMAPQARVVLGQWTDPLLLAGEQFDTLVVDYVIGAIDGHAPYFQYGFLQRIRQHLRPGGRMYLIGMEPPPRDGSALDEIVRMRDACILLAGHRCYREYPQALVLSWVEQLGLEVLDAVQMPNRLGARFINGQLDVAQRKLPLFRDQGLSIAMGQAIAELRERALAGGDRVWGSDWVIAARAGVES